MDDVRLVRQLDDPLGAREMEILDPHPLIELPARLTKDSGESCGPAHPAHSVPGQLDGGFEPEILPAAALGLVGYDEDVRVVGNLESNGHLRAMPARAVLALQIAGDIFSAAPHIRGADLENVSAV